MLAIMLSAVLLSALALAGGRWADQRWFGWVLLVIFPVLLGAFVATFTIWFSMSADERWRLSRWGGLDRRSRRRRPAIEEELPQEEKRRAHGERVARSRSRLGPGRRRGRRDPAGP